MSLKMSWQMICQEIAAKTLERLGYRVGEGLIERVSKDTPRFKNELEAIVFLCKQFWVHTFNKPMDNLKTNHQVSRRGDNVSCRIVRWCFQDTYVLYDNEFRLLTHISHSAQYSEEAKIVSGLVCEVWVRSVRSEGSECDVGEM